MFRAAFPRLYELRDLTGQNPSASAYFQNFEDLLQDRLANAVFVRWEKKLQALDAQAWNALKQEALPYLTRRDARRGYQQLFDILGQADAYQYLKTNGCLNVHFIPRSTIANHKTPDLEGCNQSTRVLCEVKTINISDDEIDARAGHKVRGISNQLDDAFLHKLQRQLAQAKAQLTAYDPNGLAQHFAYVNICFDDWVGYFTAVYLQQIQQYLTLHPVPDVQVVCADGR